MTSPRQEKEKGPRTAIVTDWGERERKCYLPEQRPCLILWYVSYYRNLWIVYTLLWRKDRLRGKHCPNITKSLRHNTVILYVLAVSVQHPVPANATLATQSTMTADITKELSSEFQKLRLTDTGDNYVGNSLSSDSMVEHDPYWRSMIAIAHLHNLYAEKTRMKDEIMGYFRRPGSGTGP